MALNLNITENGDYVLRNVLQGAGGGTTVLLVSGVKGTATLAAGYVDTANNWIPFENGTLDVNKQYPIMNVDIPIIIRVTGSDNATDIHILYSEGR